MKITIARSTGSILDIGGGGEGVIGRVTGKVIDRQSTGRIDEAPMLRKRLMDATDLLFP